jgi:hypothetical protein
MTADDELQDTRDHVWEVLGSTPIRRAMLGRERADAIVRVALGECMAANVFGPVLARTVEDRVRARYRDRDGFAFMSLLIAWAISAIVQAVVAHWLNSRETAK